MSYHNAQLTVRRETPNAAGGFTALIWTFSYECRDGKHQLGLDRIYRESKQTKRHKLQGREIYSSTFRRDSQVRSPEDATPEDVRAEARQRFLQTLTDKLAVTF